MTTAPSRCNIETMRTVRAVVVTALVAALTATPAGAHDGTHEPTPPRLECWSPDADFRACRAYRWIMRARVHIGPHGYVRYLSSTLPRCGEYVGSVEEQATATPPVTECYWNHKRDGGGELGESYVDLGDGWLVIVNGYRLNRHRA